MSRGVFSFLDEQRRFLLALIGFLTFLAVMSAGIMLSMSTAVGRFSNNLKRTGVIMVMPGDGMDSAKKILDANKNDITNTRVIDKAGATKMLKTWIQSADVLGNYIPQMIEIRTKTPDVLAKIEREASKANVRFTAAAAATPDRGVGYWIIAIAGLILILVFGALGICIIHSVRNIILIHSREIGILGQIGATNSYIASQIQGAMLRITIPAVGAGFVASSLMLLLVNGLSRTARVGLLANMGMTTFDWILLMIVGCGTIVLTAVATHKTTMNILAK